MIISYNNHEMLNTLRGDSCCFYKPLCYTTCIYIKSIGNIRLLVDIPYARLTSPNIVHEPNIQWPVILQRNIVLLGVVFIELLPWFARFPINNTAVQLFSVASNGMKHKMNDEIHKINFMVKLYVVLIITDMGFRNRIT